MTTPGSASGTTLVAQHRESGKRLTIADSDLDDLRQLSDARLLICPFCDGLLTLKAGSVRVHHFAHVDLEACRTADHEPETDAHRAGKLTLYRRFQSSAADAALEQHLPATDQRADVYIAKQEDDNLRRYALEFQQANNSAARWQERHQMYNDQGINDIWLLGQVRYQQVETLEPISVYDPLPVPHTEFEAAAGVFRIREMEKQMLLYSPLLHYLDPDTQIVTLLVKRTLHANTLRAYHYRFPLTACDLRDGKLLTPLSAALDRLTSG